MYKSHIFSITYHIQGMRKTSLFSVIPCIYKLYFVFYFVFLGIYAVIYPQIQLCKVRKNNRIDTAKQAIAAGT